MEKLKYISKHFIIIVHFFSEKSKEKQTLWEAFQNISQEYFVHSGLISMTTFFHHYFEISDNLRV